MWTAYWQADGDMRYEIATTTFKHTAEFERDEFIKRMTHPECGVWFTWLESDTGEVRPTMNWKQWRVEGRRFRGEGE
jgi:hypothetical protein